MIGVCPGYTSKMATFEWNMVMNRRILVYLILRQTQYEVSYVIGDVETNGLGNRTHVKYGKNPFPMIRIPSYGRIS